MIVGLLVALGGQVGKGDGFTIGGISIAVIGGGGHGDGIARFDDIALFHFP